MICSLLLIFLYCTSSLCNSAREIVTSGYVELGPPQTRGKIVNSGEIRRPRSVYPEKEGGGSFAVELRRSGREAECTIGRFHAISAILLSNGARWRRFGISLLDLPFTLLFLYFESSSGKKREKAVPLLPGRVVLDTRRSPCSRWTS